MADAVINGAQFLPSLQVSLTLTRHCPTSGQKKRESQSLQLSGDPVRSFGLYVPIRQGTGRMEGLSGSE